MVGRGRGLGSFRPPAPAAPPVGLGAHGREEPPVVHWRAPAAAATARTMASGAAPTMAAATAPTMSADPSQAYDGIFEENMAGYFTDLLNSGVSDSQYEETVTDSQNVGQTPAAPTSKRPNHKRAKNFSEEEDKMIVSAWLNVSTDAVRGNDQSETAYWARVHDYFHSNKNFTSEQLMEARTMYKEETKRPFQLLHCWNLLRFEQKWIERRGFLDSNKSGNKRQRANEEVSPTQNVNSDSGDPMLDTSPESNLQRPPRGRKSEKLYELRKKRQEERMAKFWEKKEEVGMKRDSVRKDRFDEFMALERERFEHKKQIDEDAIMMMDTSSMTEMQLLYHKSRQEEIMHRRMSNTMP